MSEVESGTTFSRGERQTIELGRVLGKVLVPGSIVSLYGEIGAGKTRLVQGIALGLEVPASDHVVSPSFALIHEHKGRLSLYHMDFFRLQPGVWEPELGVEEYLSGEGVCVIEWPERIQSWLTPERLDVLLSILGPGKRRMSFSARGRRHIGILNALVLEACQVDGLEALQVCIPCDSGIDGRE